MSLSNTLHYHSINLNGKLYSLKEPLIVGILNITPDSFFDGGKYLETGEILKRAELMVSEGVDIIDIGGQSTKPGATTIGEKDELKRVLPVIDLLQKNFSQIPLSIDTYYSEVAQQAVGNGVAMVNDISAGSLDARMFETVAQLKVPYVLMHMQGEPSNMQQKPTYNNAVQEIAHWLSVKIAQLKELGVNDIIIDLGFGFGKTQEHNYELLAGMSHFQLFDLPILAGLSRKSMIWKAINSNAENALNGTTALNILALEQGANLLRVHDVKAAKEAITLFSLYKKAKQNLG